MKIFIPILISIFTPSAALAAQSLTLDGLKAVEHGAVQGAYRCAGSGPKRWDVSIAYELNPMSTPRSRVEALTIRSQDQSKQTIARINSAIAGRSIESVVVSCASSKIRVVLTLYSPETAISDHLQLLKRDDAPLEIAEY